MKYRGFFIDNTDVSVSAVVVTRNRKELLCRCLEGLAAQTYKLSRVVVVDNASEYPYETFVRKQNFAKDLNIIWHRLDINTGGAGGFYEGMKLAIELGTDLIWLMDDDGYPESNCLHLLLQNMHGNCFIGPLVVSDRDESTLAFSFRLPGSMHVIDSANDPVLANKTVIDDVLLPFNGVLIPSDVVSRYGLPKKEMFVWGDEIEYTWRMQSYGINIGIVVNARFRHPRPVMTSSPMFFSILRFNDTDSKVKLYCLIRNSVWSYLKYKGKIKAALFVLKVFWFYFFTKPSFHKLRIATRGVCDGLIGRFDRHHIFAK